MEFGFAGLALHTWSLETTELPAVIDAAKRAGFDAVELRAIDYKRHYENGFLDDQINDMVRAGGLPVALLGVEYGWLFATGDESRRLWGVFEQQCRNAVALGCPTLMSAAGPLTGTLTDAIANTRLAGDLAAEHGLKLAIEFSYQHPLLNSVERMREVIEGAEKPNVGLLLDTYHLQRSGRPGRGFEEVPGEEIFAVQFSDCAEAFDPQIITDRLLPGEGVVRWGEVFTLLAEKGYRGYLSYEAPNPTYWERDPYEAARDAFLATRRLLAAAAEAASAV